MDLITDRTESDVARLLSLIARIDRVGWDNLTPEERAEYLRGSAIRLVLPDGPVDALDGPLYIRDGVVKGMYNASDRNRVGAAVRYLTDLLHSYGYAVTTAPKTDWVNEHLISPAELSNYLADVTAIKAAFYGATPLPAAMDNIDHEDANNIERLLLEIESYIIGMEAAFQHCGTTFSGMEGIRV